MKLVVYSVILLFVTPWKTASQYACKISVCEKSGGSKAGKFWTL